MFVFLFVYANAILVSQNDERNFLLWMRKYHRLFTGEEYQFRLGVFLTNARFVDEHNRRQSTFKLALNRFAVYTQTEYEALLGDRSHSLPHVQYYIPISEPPNQCDWRDSGVVNEIQDQGDCGSCWAFSLIQSVESQCAVKRGILHKLSEQELVDCSPESGGCGGGDRQRTLSWMIEEHSGTWMHENDYPYEAATMTCRSKKENRVCKMIGACLPQMMSEDVLMQVVATRGPASVSMDARWSTFRLYDGGIYDEPRCNELWLGHAVGVVGYGEENGLKYWILRNSWGTDWGEKGYARMIRNKGNQCGLATEALIPVCAP